MKQKCCLIKEYNHIPYIRYERIFDWFVFLGMHNYIELEGGGLWESMRYSKLKKTIISEGVDSLLDYSEHKADFINQVLRKASDMKRRLHLYVSITHAVLRWQRVGPGNWEVGYWKHTRQGRKITPK